MRVILAQIAGFVKVFVPVPGCARVLRAGSRLAQQVERGRSMSVGWLRSRVRIPHWAQTRNTHPLKAIALVATLALAACTHTPPAEPLVVVKRVEIPVVIPCPVKLPDYGPLPSEGHDLTNTGIYGLAALAAADLLELKARNVELEAAARACAG